jgi:RNA binding exosome subunit
MTEAAQRLVQQMQVQVLKSAEDFYGNSLGTLESQLENDRSQLQELIEQLPESQQETAA